jgi:methylmalonyl-CoA/ethylmalonyl-CoA epimerase
VAARRRDPYSAVEEIMESAACASSPSGKPSGISDDLKIEHIGIATANLENAVKFWGGLLGLSVEPSEEVQEQGVRVAMLPIGETHLELLEATREDSPVGRFLSKRGAGIHHMALRVEDIGKMLENLRARGIRLIDEAPRVGAGGCLVAFIHPSSSNGVLLELVQHTESSLKND